MATAKQTLYGILFGTALTGAAMLGVNCATHRINYGRSPEYRVIETALENERDFGPLNGIRKQKAEELKGYVLEWPSGQQFFLDIKNAELLQPYFENLRQKITEGHSSSWRASRRGNEALRRTLVDRIKERFDKNGAPVMADGLPVYEFIDAEQKEHECNALRAGYGKQ